MLWFFFLLDSTNKFNTLSNSWVLISLDTLMFPLLVKALKLPFIVGNNSKEVWELAFSLSFSKIVAIVAYHRIDMGLETLVLNYEVIGAIAIGLPLLVGGLLLQEPCSFPPVPWPFLNSFFGNKSTIFVSFTIRSSSWSSCKLLFVIFFHLLLFLQLLHHETSLKPQGVANLHPCW